MKPEVRSKSAAAFGAALALSSLMLVALSSIGPGAHTFNQGDKHGRPASYLEGIRQESIRIGICDHRNRWLHELINSGISIAAHI
jgi:hypothetical protein